MPIRFDKKALSFLYRFFVKGRTDARQIPYIPSKTRLMGENTESKLPRARPERKGISSKCINNMLCELEADKTSTLHCLGVLADGAVICEACAPGYDFGMWTLTHSMCKTVTGLAIGMLVDEGKLALDTPIYKILDDDLPTILGIRMRQITVRHLLTMSSGITFNEMGSVTSEDWVRSFFESPVDFEPGKNFAYNSMNSYMLSAIVKKVSGESMTDYLRTRLFDVLGVEDVLWETCPKGIEKGGWGLYITPETMLKLGSLFINDGKYGDTQIVSASWINEMSKRQISVSEDAGNYDYGYQMWVGRSGTCCLFNGMFGQNILVFPKKKIVIAVTASNSEMFQKGSLLAILERTFSGDSYLAGKKRLKEFKALLKTEQSFFKRRAWIKHTHYTGFQGFLYFLHKRFFSDPIPLQFEDICGKKYYLEKNNLSFMPTFLSLIQNNLGEGLQAIEFIKKEHELFVKFYEGSETYTLNVGFDAPKQNKLNVRGEMYLVSVWTQFTENEDRQELLKLEIIYPENPAHRRMKLYFEGDSLSVHMLELPSNDIINNYVTSLLAVAPKSKPLIDFLLPQLENEYIVYKIRDTLSPVLSAKTEKPTSNENDSEDDEFEKLFIADGNTDAE